MADSDQVQFGINATENAINEALHLLSATEHEYQLLRRKLESMLETYGDLPEEMHVRAGAVADDIREALHGT